MISQYSTSQGIHKKLIHIVDRNTGTIISWFVVAKFDYFQNRHVYFLKAVRQIRMADGTYRAFRNEVPLGLD